jgi:hypothetical protein
VMQYCDAGSRPDGGDTGSRGKPAHGDDVGGHGQESW